MRKKPTLLNIFLTFLYIGTIMLGGGYVVLPILNDEVVKKTNWISYDDLLDLYALSQALPGLIVVNVAIFIGYKLRGIPGAIAAVLGSTFTAFWSIILLSSIIFNDRIFPYFSFSFKCIEIAVIVLIYLSIREMWVKSVLDKTTFFLFCFALLMLFAFKLSPINVILVTTTLGSLLFLYKTKRSSQ